METQFEIQSRLEKKHYVEYFLLFNKKRFWTIALFLALGCYYLIKNLYAGKLIFLWCIGWATWIFLRPWLAAGKVFKRELQYEDAEYLRSVTKFGDEILDESKSMTTTTPYDRIESIYISSELIILRDTRKADNILNKNGFTKGTFEEFLPFIQEKCPQAKIYKK